MAILKVFRPRISHGSMDTKRPGLSGASQRYGDFTGTRDIDWCLVEKQEEMGNRFQPTSVVFVCLLVFNEMGMMETKFFMAQMSFFFFEFGFSEKRQMAGILKLSRPVVDAYQPLMIPVTGGGFL